MSDQQPASTSDEQPGTSTADPDFELRMERRLAGGDPAATDDAAGAEAAATAEDVEAQWEQRLADESGDGGGAAETAGAGGS